MTPAVSPRRRLLVVDDEKSVLNALRRTLRGGGWEVATAQDAESGLEALERFTPEVVIADFRMPGMDGVDFLTRVKEHMPHAQRIMLTGQADEQVIEEAINRSEIFRFISKPWNDNHLRLTVKSAFEQYLLRAENACLYRVAREQNAQLKDLNADLEARVVQRTQALSQAKRDWELTFDSLDTPLALVDLADGTVRRANQAYARAAGRRVEDARGVACHRYLFGRDTPCPGCSLQAAARSGQVARATLELGDRTYLLSAHPLPGENCAVCTYQDVTEERAMTRRLVEAEKMAAVGQLAGGVAHEINNPLGGILAFSQLMKRDRGRTEADLESLDLIEESALRCKRIVDSLLKLSRHSRREDRYPLDLSRCVEDATLLFKAQLKSIPKVKLELKLAPELPPVLADAGQIAQVVLILLQNGLQALPQAAGTLTLETGRRAERCFLCVSDTGRGIEERHLPHIFEPSFTTKPPGEGTGLGLSIAYRIVHDHGGTFDVDTRVGAGSRFTVLLPIPTHPQESQ
ncbi:ATP-binding response regulator [Corallococcus caeni]|uniref:ATP-binding response regulator n=1 Tax=Corallococcus caeni TaxID=3082388 RepID=UPI0030C6AF15